VVWMTGREGIVQIEPAEANVVQRMFDCVDRESLSARRVLMRLNERKVTPRKGSGNPVRVDPGSRPQGSAGLAALHAAALDDTVRSAAVTGTLVSYAAIVENEIYTHRYSMFAPGALRKYDLPEVAALIAPRPLVVINAVDEMQRPVELKRAAEIYEPARKIFDLVGARSDLRVERAVSATDILEKYRALVLK